MNEILRHSFPPAIEFPIDSGIYNVFLSSDFLIRNIQLYLPCMQRELDPEWIDTLRDKIHNTYISTGYVDIGTIHVAFYNNTFFLVDGQHRFVILNDLIKTKTKIPVHVKLYEVSSEDELSNLFAKVNGSKPSKIYQSTQTQTIINTFRKYMTEEYGDYFSKSDQPKKPHINLQQLVDEIMKKDLLSKLHINDPQTLIDAVEEINTFYRHTTFDTWNTWKVKETDVLQCYHKRSTKKLYLGVYRNFEWIDRLIMSKQHNKPYSNMHHVPLKFRLPINKKKRRAVWDKRNLTLNEGRCFVCNESEEFDYDNFECGHIVAVYWGGDTSLDNLEPICKECNTKMGVQNLHEYKKIHYGPDSFRSQIPAH